MRALPGGSSLGQGFGHSITTLRWPDDGSRRDLERGYRSLACVRNPSTGVCRSPVYDSVEVDRAVVCLSNLGRGQFGRDTAWDRVSRAPEGLRRPVLGLRQLLGRMKKNLRMWRRKRKKRCGWVGKEDAAHLPLASSRAQTARWAAVRGGTASGGVGGSVSCRSTSEPPRARGWYGMIPYHAKVVLRTQL